MSPDALLWTAPPAPRCKAKPPETLWSVRKAGRRTDCILQCVGEDGWDVALVAGGDEFFGRRFVTRSQALTEAAELRRYLERDGWQDAEN